MVGRCRTWHAIIVFGQHKRSNDVRRGMTSPPLDSTHGRTTLGVARNHRPWKVHTVGNVGRDMPSLPLDNTHGRTTSGLTCHHRLRTAHMVGLRRAWNDITALVQHTRSNNVWRGMTSPPLDCTHDRTMSGVACHHRLLAAQTVKQRQPWHDNTALGQHTRSNDVVHGMTSSPLDCSHGRTTLRVA